MPIVQRKPQPSVVITQKKPQQSQKFDNWGNSVGKPVLKPAKKIQDIQPIKAIQSNDINVKFGQNVEGIATVDREILKSQADQSALDLDSLLAGMFDTDFGGEDQLDLLMEQSLGELKPLEPKNDQGMEGIFEETLGFMPEMETELLSFQQIQNADSPNDLQVDELYSQLESLFGDITLNKQTQVQEKLQELDTDLNDKL